MNPSIAVLIPCYNEAATIQSVVRSFVGELPEAEVWVFDNNSNDQTAELAAKAGAKVVYASQRGKGNVVRRMFADVEADAYLMVDGDDTYDPASSRDLLEAILDSGCDMSVAVRKPVAQNAYRKGHALGNRALGWLLGMMFGSRVEDVFSGYRAFSRRFAKSFPTLSTGFEIETEMTVHALSLRMDVAEIDSDYSARPEGSESKLRTWNDGWNVLGTMVKLFMVERPLFFYSLLAVLLFLVGSLLGVPVVVEWLETGFVPRFPTAILASAVMVLSALSLFAGMILDTVSRGRREGRMLAYLQHPSPHRQ